MKPITAPLTNEQEVKQRYHRGYDQGFEAGFLAGLIAGVFFSSCFFFLWLWLIRRLPPLADELFPENQTSL